ncbi:conjugal transfer protein [Carnobacterium maltaromaticum]
MEFKKKEKKVKSPKLKQVSQKKANLFIVFIAILFVGVLAVGTIKNLSSVTAIDKLNKEIVTLKKENLSTETEITQIDYPLVERYMGGFVSAYMNVDLSKDEIVQQRLKNLEKYFAFDVSKINDNLDKKTTRKLTSLKLLNIQTMKQYDLAKYKVEYEIIEMSLNEKTKKEEKRSSKVSSILCIPYVQSDGLITVVSLPYFSSEQDVYGKAPALEMSESSDTTEAMAKVKPSIEKYLPTFFKKYAESNKADLTLLMKKVELMGGNYELDKVDVSQARYSFVGENVLVQVYVSFKNKETDFVHTEPFTLQLAKQEKSWFVVDMQHVFIK